MAKICFSRAKVTELAGKVFLFDVCRWTGLSPFSINALPCSAQTQSLFNALPKQISLRHFPKPAQLRTSNYTWTLTPVSLL